MTDQEWIEEMIDRWHDNIPCGPDHFSSGISLHQYLGMTWEQYAFYVENNKILPEGWERPVD